MTSGAMVHILYQGSTACGLWWSNTPKADKWLAPWEWPDLDKLIKDKNVTPCPQCAEAYQNKTSEWCKNWGDILGN